MRRIRPVVQEDMFTPSKRAPCRGGALIWLVCIALPVLMWMDYEGVVTKASTGSHSVNSYLKAFKAEHSLRSSTAGNRRASQCNPSPAVKCHQHPLLLAEGIGGELPADMPNSRAKAPAGSTWQPCLRADNSTVLCIHPKLHPHGCGVHNMTAISQQQQQQQQEALIVPQRIVVRASRSALQRYLDSPEFAEEAAAAFPAVPLGRNPSGGSPNPGQEAAASSSHKALGIQQEQQQQQQQEQEHGQQEQGRRWGPTNSSGRLVTKRAAQDTSATTLDLHSSNNSDTTTTSSSGSSSSNTTITSSSGSSSSTSWRRGILVVAGGRPLLTQLAVQLKVLRETLGCSLPVEVAWQGPEEMNEATLAALQREFGPLRGFDVQAMPYPPHMRRVQLTRFVGKVAALLHCSFREVLLLDADNLPLADPTYLFDDPLYRQRGNLFWPDYWSNWVNDEVYPFLGLERTVVQPQLRAGAGFTGRDTESGMLLLDCQRWLKVLYWTFWINTWHDRLYENYIYGDKDTFALGFALAGMASEFRQVSVVPGGVFRWGQGQLEVKAADGAPASITDGWQLLGALHYDDTGRPLFLHRTMNKLDLDAEPWPAELITGPLPSRWLQYYLAHDSTGPTKGVAWEHTAPHSAFAVVQQPTSTGSGLDASQELQTAGHQGLQAATASLEAEPHVQESSSYKTNATSSRNGISRGRGMDSCPLRLFSLYTMAQQAGLPVDDQPSLECWCSGVPQAHWQQQQQQQQQQEEAASRLAVQQAGRDNATTTAGHAELVQTSEADSAPVAAVRVTP